MANDITSEISTIKTAVVGCPDDQKTSFIGGISDGLRIAALIANKTACNLARR